LLPTGGNCGRHIDKATAEVLDAERRLFGSGLSDAVNRADVYVTLVHFYKTMRFGWVEHAEVMAD
jgi:hypothetical protein